MLPTAKSSALKAVRPYRCLLGCTLSPALRSYVNSCLRRLKTIDRSVSEEPLRPGTLRDAGVSGDHDGGLQGLLASLGEQGFRR